MWQCVSSEEDRQSAERKLDRWLVKPTDGIYARLNRRISIPISRQLIKFPITANMVTLFTLGVGFASGPNQWTHNATAAHLRQAVEGSLKRLRVERIDLYQLHTPDPVGPSLKSISTNYSTSTLFTVQKALPLLSDGGSIILNGSVASVNAQDEHR